jgi:integrase
LPALREADLQIHVRPQDLRHAHASWLLAGGADLQVVKERLGHGTIKTTKQYLHTLHTLDDADADADDADDADDDADETALDALAAIRGRHQRSPDRSQR